MPVLKSKIVGIGFAIAASAVVATAKAEGQPGVFVYEIQHPEYGTVGTFTNVIKRRAGTTVVNSHTRIEVKMGPVTLFRQDADRMEVWCGGRLKYYDSLTNTNGDDAEVRGWANGGSFVVEGRDARVEAPADVYPTNPWLTGITGAKSIISPVAGRLQNVSIGAAKSETVELAGRQIDAERFEVGGDLELDLWYDPEGTLVKFTYPSKHDMLTFELTERREPAPDEVFQPASCAAGQSIARAEFRRRPEAAPVRGTRTGAAGR